MKTLLNTLTACAWLTCACAAQAASTAELTVGGLMALLMRVVTPKGAGK